MALTNLFPAGSESLTAEKLNQTVPFSAQYEQRSSQDVNSVTDTKMTFDTPVELNDEVVASGTGNTDFLLKRAGRWLVTAGVRYNGDAGGGERHIAIQTGSSFDIANRIAFSTDGNVGADPVSVTTSRMFTTSSETTIIVDLWQNSGNIISTNIDFGHATHISLCWLGP